MTSKNGSLPHDSNAEKSLLGSMLLSPSACDSALQRMIESDFHEPRHKCLLGLIRGMREERRPVELLTLRDAAEKSGVLGEIGGDVYVAELFTYIEFASNWPYYADILKEKAVARRTITFCNHLIADANNPAEQKNLPAKLQAAMSSIVFPESTRTLPPMVSAKELCKNPPPTPPEIIEGILHQGSKLAFGGGSKSFKTWTLLELSTCIATGRDWLGFPTTKGRVLYVNLELPAFSIQKRISEICEAMGVEVPEDLKVWNLRGYATNAATILPMISREAKAGGFLFIVLDPLYKLLGDRDENASRDMANLMNLVERLAVDTGAAVAFGSHFAKGNASGKESMDRISGSGVFARDPDSIVTMTQHEEDGAFTVEMTLRNFAPQESFVVRRKHPLMVIDGQLDPAKLKQVGGRKAIHTQEDILEHLEGSMTSGEWEKACKERGIGRSTFFDLKSKLKAAGHIFQSAIDEKWSRRV
jgi:hypothetical protein